MGYIFLLSQAFRYVNWPTLMLFLMVKPDCIPLLNAFLPDLACPSTCSFWLYCYFVVQYGVHNARADAVNDC